MKYCNLYVCRNHTLIRTPCETFQEFLRSTTVQDGTVQCMIEAKIA